MIDTQIYYRSSENEEEFEKESTKKKGKHARILLYGNWR